ncbi:prepilin-type N-terminal cleavage/methylation domain-containing protein [Uliginosibacterium sp. H3]|uniref:Prepilin-type N-terminal cleavage/methylation domain-containing protein n=1 Tax=Uliginosibacterium silvisoli TaxID=3114758 RepID=A0ABU6JXI6_9RHOO|nr:prepilin-type N-terminal cleavage/methylation domain-containing protein [Uliginosibacterium sp. H3]
MRHALLDTRRFASGFSLVELMIAMVLGLIVVGGALAVFVGQRVTNNLSVQMVDVQSEGRIAMDALARDLRAAGDFGCWPVSNPIDKRLNNEQALSADDGGIVGFDSQSGLPADSGSRYGLAKLKTSLPDANPASLANQSSILAVVGVSGTLTSLKDAMSSQAAALVVNRPLESFKADDIAVITDCINWAKFQVTTVTDGSSSQTLAHSAGAQGDASYGKGNKDGSIGELFSAGASVGRLDTTWWFMGKVGGKSGLYRMSARDNTPVLVSDKVVGLAVRYDQATGSTGAITQRDQSASSVTASATKWTSVRSATVQMLLRSEKVGNAGQQTVSSFNGVSIDADSHVYLPLQMTVALRNQ